MADLTEMLLQEFSDKVADICELMELDSEQMLQAIGSTTPIPSAVLYHCRFLGHRYWHLLF